MLSEDQLQDRERTVRRFHELYYNHFEQTWEQTYWLGHKVLKCPLDLWIYQELLFRVRPDVIVECGTAHGGSALYLASLLELIGEGRVLTVDVAGPDVFASRPRHPRIEYLTGSSTSEDVLAAIRERLRPNDRVLVILDSDHRQAHVRAELDAYAPLVSVGSYLVVEDTNVHGHPVAPEHEPGPMEALDDFLGTTEAFVSDAECEKFYLTFNPKGYLLRVA